MTRTGAVVEAALLDHCARDWLNDNAPRRLAVLRPLKIVIENYPQGKTEMLQAVNNPRDSDAGTREVPFSRELYVERDDFMEDPPRKFFRLAPGREVRLRFAYFITCREVIKDAKGVVSELRCTYDPATRGGDSPDGRKVKGTLHWVSAAHAVPAQIRLYAPLFADASPEGDLAECLNPDSLTILDVARLEPSLAEATPDDPIQFERQGYFRADPDSTPGRLVFNRTIALRDSWAKTKGA